MEFNRWYRSLLFALKGIKHAWQTQSNLRIHGIIAILVIVLGASLNLSRWEWIALSFAIALVLTAEIINTAIEWAIDLVTRDYHPLAASVKNAAAGAVVITVLNAVIVGVLILGPPLWSLLTNFWRPGG